VQKDIHRWSLTNKNLKRQKEQLHKTKG